MKERESNTCTRRLPSHRAPCARASRTRAHAPMGRASGMRRAHRARNERVAMALPLGVGGASA
jgi:hypothetical protein